MSYVAAGSRIAPFGSSMTIILTIFGIIFAIALYVAAVVVTHGLFERRCMSKRGCTLKEWVDKSKGQEWSDAFDERAFAIVISMVWPLAPLALVLRFCYRWSSKIAKSVAPAYRALHHWVIYPKDRIGATSEDSNKGGAYRAKSS